MIGVNLFCLGLAGSPEGQVQSLIIFLHLGQIGRPLASLGKMESGMLIMMSG
jgi:hypothetical protein